MGNKYTVEAWGNHWHHKTGELSYMEVWRGENFFMAVWQLIKAKRKGYKCVKLEWRA